KIPSDSPLKTLLDQPKRMRVVSPSVVAESTVIFAPAPIASLAAHARTPSAPAFTVPQSLTNPSGANAETNASVSPAFIASIIAWTGGGTVSTDIVVSFARAAL